VGKRLTAMLAGALALAAIAGCGGSDSEESLSKAQYIKQGDAICQEAYDEYQSEYDAYAKEHGIKKGAFPSRKQLYEVMEEFYIPSREARLAGLQELNPPSADEDEVEAILAATEDGLEKANKNAQLLFGETPYPFEKANDLSTAYGFEVCNAT